MAANGNTDLHVAAALGDVTNVKVLLSNGARPDAENTFGRLPEEVASNPEIRAVLRDARVALARKEREELVYLRQKAAELEAEVAKLSVKDATHQYRIDFLVRSMRELRTKP